MITAMQLNRKNPAGYRWTPRHVGVPGHGLRILIVDDNENAADAMAMFLAQEDDFVCRAAYGGIQAIDIARTWTPDLILMDISMPECNGYDASRVLRRDASTRDIAIIAHTALDEAEIRRHLRDTAQSAFDGYCQKGRSLDSLLALLHSFMQETV